MTSRLTLERQAGKSISAKDEIFHQKPYFGHIKQFGHQPQGTEGSLVVLAEDKHEFKQRLPGDGCLSKSYTFFLNYLNSMHTYDRVGVYVLNIVKQIP